MVGEEIAVVQMSGMLVGIGILVAMFVITILVYKMFYPAARYENYLQSYKIGRLVKHAKEKGIDFVFEKAPRSEIQRIDAAFEDDVKVPEEISEIEQSKVNKKKL